MGRGLGGRVRLCHTTSRHKVASPNRRPSRRRSRWRGCEGDAATRLGLRGSATLNGCLCLYRKAGPQVAFLKAESRATRPRKFPRFPDMLDQMLLAQQKNSNKDKRPRIKTAVLPLLPQSDQGLFLLSVGNAHDRAFDLLPNARYLRDAVSPTCRPGRCGMRKIERTISTARTAEAFRSPTASPP